MITCYPILGQQMKENRVTYADLAGVIKTSTTTLLMKMLGLKRWKLTEVLRICCFFNTPDAEHLFQKKLCIVCPITL